MLEPTATTKLRNHAELERAWQSAKAATEQAKAKFDAAVSEVRAAITKLEVPWVVQGIVMESHEFTAVPPPSAFGNLHYKGRIEGRAAPRLAAPLSLVSFGEVRLDPYYVILERLNGTETKVVSVPASTDKEALDLANKDCDAADDAWHQDVNAIVERCGIEAAREAWRKAADDEWEAHQRLRLRPA
jgi:hypothetical protein